MSLDLASGFLYNKTMKTKNVLSVSSSGDQFRQRLVTQSRELFFRYGFSRVSMDELAEDLGISKATIYRYFPDKESLLREVLKEVRGAMLSQLEELQSKAELSCREKLMNFFTSLGQTMSLINRELLKDIRFKLPDVWQEIEAFRREKIFPIFCQMVLEGVKKGEFRSDLDARLFLEIFYFLAQEFVNPDWLVKNDYAPSQLLDSIMRILFFGIFLEKDKAAGGKNGRHEKNKKRKGHKDEKK
ncbi:MAG TPA: TetR/AcrR family transcriptional regulator [Candidatus Saccharicenans sp.]|mgnify:FL=1|nr:TetR/AcrR family transcriptional regulator [Candidatus Saccharicenans sp.]HQH61520.1 TetR/AcrR family transcriptional regulator [Candidatus Saccharicenans sp.]HQI22913.1 TetR/AcrR family transcriptional regulator [Candidatus Saccharicenans sp.]